MIMTPSHLFKLSLISAALLVALNPAWAADTQSDSSAGAQFERGFYLGGALGLARGAVDAGEMNQRMAQLGYDANAEVHDQNRMSWSLDTGYRWNRYVETQLGYTDLGEVSTRLSGSAADINNYLNSANLVHPRTGSGYQFALLGRYPLSDKTFVYGRAGLFMVDADYRATTDGANARRSDSERSEFFGLGIGRELAERWELRLGVDRFTVEDENIPVAALGFIYKFSGAKRPAPAPQPTLAATPAPAPEPTPAEQLAAPVSITLAVNFATNSAQLAETSMGEIIKLADFMKRYSATRVVLEGHTDNRGSDTYNQNLSSRRAQAVRDALVERGGIAPERVDFIGYGETRPIANNNSAAGQDANRRVMAEISNVRDE